MSWHRLRQARRPDTALTVSAAPDLSLLASSLSVHCSDPPASGPHVYCHTSQSRSCSRSDWGRMSVVLRPDRRQLSWSLRLENRKLKLRQKVSAPQRPAQAEREDTVVTSRTTLL